MRRRWFNRARPETWKQGELPFLVRSRRLDRVFKRSIVSSLVVMVGGIFLGTSGGRFAAASLAFQGKKSVTWLLGIDVDRADYVALRDRARLRGISQTRDFLEQVAIDRGPTMREFLRIAKIDRDSAVIRWGNVDWILALSSAVFEPDDTGRSYRLLPNTRSIWLINLTINKVQAFFEIPDTPEARRLGEAVGGRVVPESVQTTNSWGCRGPDPDPTAPVRGLILGDSNMQGLLVGDDQTPPARLEARLRVDLGVPVSILNTGHLGYSPEQYYHTLIAYYDRFKPQFVVVSICSNDFGDMKDDENWKEGEYWLDEIAQFCRTRELAYLAVPVPDEDAMIGRRNETTFPSRVSAIFDGSGLNYLNPMEEFTTEHLKLKVASHLDKSAPPYSSLFNRKYGDNHLSPLGSDLWARIVARRLELIWATQDPTKIKVRLPVD